MRAPSPATAAAPTLVALTALALAAAPPAAAQETPSAGIPERPEEIEFPPLEFAPPSREAHRHVLDDGVVVYLAPSRTLPLVDVSFTFRGGGYLDAEGKEGLASAVAAMLRRGGTAELSPQALDEKLDFLAAQASTAAGEYRTTASLDTLSRNLEESLELLVDVLRRPGFDAERLRLYKEEVLEGLKQRNDDAGDILEREWTALLYGRDHFKAALPTEASVEGLTADDLRAFHERIVHPGNLVVAASGDFEVEPFLALLSRLLEGWEAGEAPADPPAPTATLEPGVYRVEKDIPQGKVIIGQRGFQRDHPDAVALQVMSRILGSGGFTSRITQRVRSDEGLAYSAGAGMIPGLHFPGEFRAFFQSKSRTVALATKIIFEEIRRIRSEPVTAEELATAKGSLIETFPTRFGSPAATVSVFVDDELTGRPADHWATFRDRVRALTPAEIQRVAQEWLDPEAMAILVVGEWEDISAGDLEGRADMSAFDEDPEELPLRDPLSLEPTSGE